MFIQFKILSLTETIAKIVNSHLIGEDLYLVDVIISGGNPVRKILVLLDGDGGINIDACALISRKISADLDNENILESGYILEVSSPGLDHPLKLERQYHNHVGKTLKVTLTDQSIKEGELIEVLSKSIVLKQNERKLRSKKPSKAEGSKLVIGPTKIPFAEIELTKVLASFN